MPHHDTHPAPIMGDDTITYAGVAHPELEVYHWIGDGVRPLMQIGVTRDDECRIKIAPVGSENWQDTKGKAHTHPAGIAGVEDEVCLGAVITYIAPRIATMMGRCYVPKSGGTHPDTDEAA